MATGISSCGAVLLYCPHNTSAALGFMIVTQTRCYQKGAVTPPPPGSIFILLPAALHEHKVEMLVNSTELG